jgi:hypothetical protein
VSTVKKSVAKRPLAWARRSALQLGPARRGAGPKAVTAEDAGDAGFKDIDAELSKFPDDAEVAPAGVLTGRTAGSARWSRQGARVSRLDGDRSSVAGQGPGATGGSSRV